MQQDFLLECIRAASSPLSSPQERQRALEYCESWKNNISNLPIAMSILSSPNIDDLILLFGFNAVEYMIRFSYYSIPAEQKMMLKTNFIEKSKTASTRNALYRQKLSLLIVELAIREWPQQWPNLLDEILHLPDLEFSAHIFYDFIEMIHFKSQSEGGSGLLWDAERKSELQSALSACISPITNWLFDGIRKYPNSYTRLFTLLCSWADFEYISFKKLMCIIINGFLGQQVGPKEFADCLGEVSKRNLVLDYRELPDILFSEFSLLAKETFRLFSTDYIGFRNLSESILCCAYELVLKNKKSLENLNEKHLGYISYCFDFAIACLGIPSFLVMANAFHFVSSIPTLNEQQVTKLLLPSLNIISINPASFLQNKFNNKDFDDETSEFISHFSTLTTLICDVIRGLGPRFPKLIINFLVESLEANRYNPQLLRSSLILIDHSLRNLTKPSDQHQSPVTPLYHILKDVDNFSSCLYEYLAAITTVSLLLLKEFAPSPSESNFFDKFVGIMFKVATSTSDIPIDVRTKAFSSILKTVSSSPELFVGKVGELVALGQFASGQRELRLYVELILVLTASPHHSTYKFDLLNCIITPLITQIDNFSVNDLTKQSGLWNLSQGQLNEKLWKETSSYRANAGNVLTLIQTCAKRLCNVDPKGLEVALRPVIEKFYTYVMSFIVAMIKAEAECNWQPQLRREIFFNEFPEKTDDESSVEEIVIYANHWYGHLLQTCAMCLFYLADCPFTRDLFESSQQSLFENYSVIKRPSIRLSFLKYPFQAMMTKNFSIDWPKFINNFLSSESDANDSPSYQQNYTSFLGEKVNFLCTFFLTPEALNQKVDARVDLKAQTVIKSTCCKNNEHLTESVLIHLLHLLEMNVSSISGKIIVILLHHLGFLLERSEFYNLLFFILPNRIISLLQSKNEEVQGLFFSLLVECFKWLIFLGQEGHLWTILNHYPKLEDESKRCLVEKLESSTSLKSQRAEAKKCFAPLIQHHDENAPMIKKLPEKLVIMQKLEKLRKLNDEPDGIDFSSLFD